MKMELYVLILALGLVAGCSTTNSGFSKPDLSKVRTGMAKQEVIDMLGKLDNIATQGRTEYLEHGWDKFMDGLVEPAEWYYVRLADDQVESFGRKGDFDRLESDQTIRQDSRGSGDLYTELKKLKDLSLSSWPSSPSGASGRNQTADETSLPNAKKSR